MSVFDEIEKISKTVLGSDLPETIEATVLSARKDLSNRTADGKQNPVLKLELLTKDGVTFTTMYKIPKARTGKGQMDMLIEQCSKLNIHLADLVGKTFLWKKMELPGSMKGFDRHYPVKLVKK